MTGFRFRESTSHDLRTAGLGAPWADTGDLYSILADGDLIGITDEYGTAVWAAPGRYTMAAIESVADALNNDAALDEDLGRTNDDDRS